MQTKKTIETLERLVAFDTVSSNTNIELIDWAANRLADAGANIFVQHAQEPGKANLFASFGPQDIPGLMLSGHSDVVPVAGQAWSSDPFRLTERDGRLYGRGSADMKGFIACCIEMAPRFAAAKLSMPLHIALSYNEETNMGGMRQLAAHLDAAPVKPLACLIGEPTMMQVVVANKGAAIYRAHLRGFSVHSSLRDQGVSAVEYGARIVTHLLELQKQLNQAERHDGFEYPFSSVHAGRMSGGTAHNITARDCEVLFEVRALPGVSAAQLVAKIRDFCATELLPEMKAVSPECDIVIEEVVDIPGLDERTNRHLAKAIMPLCNCERPGRVSFGTEAGILQQIGVPTVVCGPGAIRVAHQPDEYVEISQLTACLEFLDALTAATEQGSLSSAFGANAAS